MRSFLHKKTLYRRGRALISLNYIFCFYNNHVLVFHVCICDQRKTPGIWAHDENCCSAGNISLLSCYSIFYLYCDLKIEALCQLISLTYVSTLSLPLFNLYPIYTLKKTIAFHNLFLQYILSILRSSIRRFITL